MNYTNTTIVSDIGAIRAKYPNMSIPDGANLSDIGWHKVIDVPQPLYNPQSQTVTLDGVELINSKWQQKWVISPLSAEQIAINQANAAKQLQDSIVASVQARLDDFAKTRNYDGILSACTYASSSVPKFAEEGQTAVDLRDQTWSALYTFLAEVLAGTKPVPTGFADVEPIMPVLAWT